MPASPSLTLVDPRARRLRFAAERILAATIGVLLVGASAIVYLNAL